MRSSCHICHISYFLYQILGLKQMVIRLKKRVICVITNGKYGADDELLSKTLTLLKISDIFSKEPVEILLKLYIQGIVLITLNTCSLWNLVRTIMAPVRAWTNFESSSLWYFYIAVLYLNAPYEQSSCIRLSRDEKAHLSNSTIRIKASIACGCKLAVPLGPDIMEGIAVTFRGGGSVGFVYARTEVWLSQCMPLLNVPCLLIYKAIVIEPSGLFLSKMEILIMTVVVVCWG